MERNVVTCVLYKRKSSKGECRNYRKMSLLGMPRESFIYLFVRSIYIDAHLITNSGQSLNRIRNLAEFSSKDLNLENGV